MVPAVFVPMPSLPLTPTGKVDQRALVDLASDAAGRLCTAARAPRRPRVGARFGIWRQDALKLETVGVLDDFFELGGDSLAAVEIVTRIESDLGQALPTVDPPRGPDHRRAGSAASDDRVRAQRIRCPPLPRSRKRAAPLFAIPGRGGDPIVFSYLAKNLNADRPFYGLGTPGLSHEQPIFKLLRRSWPRCSSKPSSEIQPSGPYYLVGFSSGALVALELARQIQALGETVAFVGVLDGWAPGYPKASSGRRWFHRLADLGPGKKRGRGAADQRVEVVHGDPHGFHAASSAVGSRRSSGGRSPAPSALAASSGGTRGIATTTGRGP